MFYSLLFFTELTTLFFLSQLLTKFLSRLFFTITRSQDMMIHLLSLVFLPGTIVHELAHWFVASILFVPTGEMEFWPKIHDNYVKLGSVAIAKTDPLRRLLIGVAPVLIGLLALFMAFYYLSPHFPGWNWQTCLLLYVFFEVGNTMYSSKKDLEGALALVIAGIIIFAGLFVLGVRIPIDVYAVFTLSPVVLFFKKIDMLLIIPIGINAFCILLPMIMQRR